MAPDDRSAADRRSWGVGERSPVWTLRRARCATLGGSAACSVCRISRFSRSIFEIHEESAGVAAEAARTLGVPLARINVNGGAPACGHLPGMSGARMV
ncbi:hypothetical protein [Streptomyces antimycoticus]|uniref:hypothetical protein n=1 Tax=Streptomyces antimycoticus TaxID=68175 RepID=UPI0038679BEA|nr:hypothetical protein OG751_44770 [Streptomyces antimycoticus]